jgi:hypothetical protein
MKYVCLASTGQKKGFVASTDGISVWKHQKHFLRRHGPCGGETWRSVTHGWSNQEGKTCLSKDLGAVLAVHGFSRWHTNLRARCGATLHEPVSRLPQLLHISHQQYIYNPIEQRLIAMLERVSRRRLPNKQVTPGPLPIGPDRRQRKP